MAWTSLSAFFHGEIIKSWLFGLVIRNAFASDRGWKYVSIAGTDSGTLLDHERDH